MFYLKTTVNGELVEIEIYQEEIHTRCFNCRNEIQIDAELLLDVLKDGDLSSTQIACCVKDKPHLIRIK